MAYKYCRTHHCCIICNHRAFISSFCNNCNHIKAIKAEMEQFLYLCTHNISLSSSFIQASIFCLVHFTCKSIWISLTFQWVYHVLDTLKCHGRNTIFVRVEIKEKSMHISSTYSSNICEIRPPIIKFYYLSITAQNFKVSLLVS